MLLLQKLKLTACKMPTFSTHETCPFVLPTGFPHLYPTILQASGTVIVRCAVHYDEVNISVLVTSSCCCRKISWRTQLKQGFILAYSSRLFCCPTVAGTGGSCSSCTYYQKSESIDCFCSDSGTTALLLSCLGLIADNHTLSLVPLASWCHSFFEQYNFFLQETIL